MRGEVENVYESKVKGDEEEIEREKTRQVTVHTPLHWFTCTGVVICVAPSPPLSPTQTRDK